MSEKNSRIDGHSQSLCVTDCLDALTRGSYRIFQGVPCLMSKHMWVFVVKSAGMVMEGYGIVIGQESVFVLL